MNAYLVVSSKNLDHFNTPFHLSRHDVREPYVRGVPACVRGRFNGILTDGKEENANAL